MTRKDVVKRLSEKVDELQKVSDEVLEFRWGPDGMMGVELSDFVTALVNVTHDMEMEAE